MRAALERGHAGLLAALCVLGALCALLLFLCLRLRARGRKVERWLEGEMARLHEEIARLHEQAARLPETAREQRPGGEAQTRGPVRAQAALMERWMRRSVKDADAILQRRFGGTE